jgi:hypothetical protein
VAVAAVAARVCNLQPGMRPRRQTEEECGEGLRSGAQYFSFRFLSGDSFNGLRQTELQHTVDTEVQGARFCESKLYLATNVGISF